MATGLSVTRTFRPGGNWENDPKAVAALPPGFQGTFKSEADARAWLAGGSGGAGTALGKAIPGLPGLTKSATDIISNALSGLPSPSQTRMENAWFGAGSGLDPTSDFLRNRGFDLYNLRGEQRQRGGLQDLLSLVGGYSGTVAPTPGEQIGASTAAANRAQQAAQFNAQLGFEREQMAKQLELVQKYLGNPAGGTGGYVNNFNPAMSGSANIGKFGNWGNMDVMQLA